MAAPQKPFNQACTEETKVRLNPEADEKLTAEAARLGIPKAVLLRVWIMERLSQLERELNNQDAA